jgi:thiamine-phosphate pyrophosphorylase
MSFSLQDARLYTFIDTGYLNGRSPAEIAHQLCDGGSDLIQLRAKNAGPEEIRRLATQIQPILRQAKVPLVINDHWELARELGAELGHLGQEDFFDAGFNHATDLRPPGQRPLLGLSTHAPAQAQRALAAEPDYIAIGPIYPTATKPTAQPVTLEYVRWAAKHVSIPWFAIGGINFQTLDAVLNAGATRICVVSAILNAPNIAQACREFRKRLS